MRVIECEQGSPEWVRARLGIPTSSCFDKILTPANLSPSRQAEKYLCDLLAEWAIGEPVDTDASAFMDRGNQLEAEAVRYYELQRDTETRAVGFVTTDDGMAGCSPDRLVGDDGGLEIKCPAAGTHVSYLLGEPWIKYRLQVQGALWITGRKWWDWMSYNPAMPPAIVRIDRDEVCIDAIRKAVGVFCGKLIEFRSRLGELGVTGWEARERQEQEDERARLAAAESYLFGD